MEDRGACLPGTMIHASAISSYILGLNIEGGYPPQSPSPPTPPPSPSPMSPGPSLPPPPSLPAQCSTVCSWSAGGKKGNFTCLQ
eukprot:scaffold62977_cov45-Phaeocystis_antarctica.AAC.1